MANMVKTKSPEAMITKPWDTFSNILLVCMQFVSHLTCFSYCWYFIVWFLYYEVLFGYSREMAHSYFKLDGIAVDLGLDHSIYNCLTTDYMSSSREFWQGLPASANTVVSQYTHTCVQKKTFIHTKLKKLNKSFKKVFTLKYPYFINKCQV